MCISVAFVLQSFLCSASYLKVLNSLSPAFLVVGILVVFDICKCVLLKFFSFISLYARSTLSPNLLSIVMFLLQYFWFLLRSDILVLANYTHMSDSFKLISLNVRGISNFEKRRMIFTWCRKKSADIIFLQETHSKNETELHGKVNGAVKLCCPMVAAIHVELQFY